jgi:hypothetical protein
MDGEHREGHRTQDVHDVLGPWHPQLEAVEQQVACGTEQCRQHGERPPAPRPTERTVVAQRERAGRRQQSHGLVGRDGRRAR